jgi:hypothetical protein
MRRCCGLLGDAHRMNAVSPSMGVPSPCAVVLAASMARDAARRSPV